MNEHPKNTFGIFFFFFFFLKQANKHKPCLGNQLADSTGSLDLLLSDPAEVLCAHNDGLVGELALSENLVVSVVQDVNNEGLTLLLRGSLLGLIGHEAPDFVEVDGGCVELLGGPVEVTHTDLSEVTGMVLVEVDALVVLTSGVTATSRMLPVLACVRWKGERKSGDFLSNEITTFKLDPQTGNSPTRP